jgi:uncharacterized membrane protein
MPSITSVNVAHLHLLLNHVPTVGTVVALGLLLVAFLRRSDTLAHVGLEVLFAIALITLPAYMSGVAAYQLLRTGSASELSETAMRLHQDAALLGFTVNQFAGFVAWIALWQARRHGRAVRGLVPAAALLGVLALALMARAATLGGEIRHAEIRAVTEGGETPVDAQQFLTTPIAQYMVESTWAWPAAETVHFLGFSLTFGVLLAINLRILGLMKQVSFADVHRLLPWGMLGFGINLITGMLFFIGQPKQYSESAPFYWKVVFLMLAGANFLYLTVFQKAWAGEGMDPRLADRAMAVSSLVAWLAVMYAGRMLPFLGNAF